jgi:hypothetical protein
MWFRAKACSLVLVALACTPGAALSQNGVGANGSKTPAAGEQSNPTVGEVFGPNLVRAEVITLENGTLNDYRVDRGLIRSLGRGSLELQERDGTIATIPIADAAIDIDGRAVGVSSLRVRMRATTLRSLSGAAKRISVSNRKQGTLDRELPKLTGGGFVRAETITVTGNRIDDYRLDQGAIQSVRGSTLTLLEADGRTVALTLDSNTQVGGRKGAGALRTLKPQMSVLTLRRGNNPVLSIWTVSPRS